MYCGGSITSIAWVPTFDRLCEQIIAVAVNLNPNYEPTLNTRCNNKALIQFWNFGHLNNAKVNEDLPKLEFCIAHEYGYVYDLEWCPSGCCDSKRMGLLAIACSDSFVYIYAVLQSALIKLDCLFI